MSKDEMQLLVEEVNKRVASGDEDTMDVCVEISTREGLSEKETRLLIDLSFDEEDLRKRIKSSYNKSWTGRDLLKFLQGLSEEQLDMKLINYDIYSGDYEDSVVGGVVNPEDSNHIVLFHMYVD